MRKAILIAVVVVVLLLGVGGYLTFRHFFEVVKTKREVATNLYYSQPMAGMLRTLKKMGMTARYDTGGLLAEEVADLDTDVSLVLFNRDYELSKPEFEQVLEWVARGGQVTLAVDNHYEFPGITYREDEWQEDVVMQSLGVRRVFEFELESGTTVGDQETAYRFGPGREILVELGSVESYFTLLDEDITFPEFGRQQPYSGMYDHEYQIQPQHIGSEQALMYARFKHGLGSVHLFHDLYFLHNREISKRRNAELVVRTMMGPGVTSEVVFTYLRRPRTLAQDLLGEGWLLIASAVISLLLWMWNVVPRNGPIVDEAPPERRSLAEHITASARFMWNHHVDAALIEPTRHALLERLRQTHAEWFSMKPGEQYRLLSELSHLPMSMVHEAMSSETERLHQDPDAFLRVMRSLEHIRRSL